MDHADRVTAAGRELDDLLAAVAAGPLSTAVPTCPGWTVADLTGHVGWFCTRWRDHLRGGGAEGRVRAADVVAPEGTDAAAAWLGGLRDELLAELRPTTADTPVWTWFPPDQTAGFVARRCASELAVHRYDAQSARGTCAPIAPDLAVDGIEELLGPLATVDYRPDGVHGDGVHGETLHLHGTDDPATTGGVDLHAEWLLRLEPDRLVASREHAKGDLALRAGVSDLELLLYGRPPLGPVQRFGDEAILDIWYGAFRF
ncbi:MAG TPA: maleylpyruvate isomerase family mycothiol-dependent enzyme [Acidimicrobiales bacterium]|nr:maleylpyruvate isomerase family mycothiol-dependent enzyme [Acidimicrobiales bacterium]